MKLKAVAILSFLLFASSQSFAQSSDIVVGDSVSDTANDGNGNIAIGNSASVGSRSYTPDSSNMAIGNNSQATNGAMALGYSAVAIGGGIAIGNNALAFGNAVNIGASGIAANEGDVIIGSGTTGDKGGISLTAGQISLSANSSTDLPTGNQISGPSILVNNQAVTLNNGNSGTLLLSNVSAGIANTDAMNVGQGQALAQALGGGASFNAGVLQLPAFTLAGTTYNDVGSALTSLDSRIAANKEAIASLQSSTSTTSPSSSTPATSSTTTSTTPQPSSTPASSTTPSTAATPDATVPAAVSNKDTMQAERYTDAAVSSTLGSANEYTDAKVAAVQSQLNSQQGSINDLYSKIGNLKNRINGVGAAAMAASSLVPLTSRPGTTQLSAAYGNYGGQSAIALGAFRINQKGTVAYNLKVTAGTGGGTSIGASTGVTWIWQ
ncbi:YadA domain-containing protein [Caballeronia peredens]|nr:YadA domain-containing protein [Caballeronia peredens]